MPHTIKKSVPLRVIGFVRDGNFQMICIDTDVAISAKSEEEAKRKLVDALVSYFKTFSNEELESGLFWRRAPLTFFLLWYFSLTRNFAKGIFYLFSSKADYDLNSHNLRLA